MGVGVGMSRRSGARIKVQSLRRGIAVTQLGPNKNVTFGFLPCSLRQLHQRRSARRLESPLLRVRIQTAFVSAHGFRGGSGKTAESLCSPGV